MGEHNQDEDYSIDEVMEEKLIERMGHLCSELAHDLRSPLQTIQNAIYLLQRSPDNEQLFTMARESLAQATQILDNFRDYYKGHILQRIEIDPIKVVDLAFSELEIPENIHLNRDVEEIGPINIDPTKLALAVRKLLINAIEAMPDGGELGVAVHKEDSDLMITISDTGVGIPEEIGEVIFTPFVASQKKGKGLGVPTAKRIVESHGGELSYKSQIDEGTVFTITLRLR